MRFQARGFPIVGTTVDYFDYRGLTINQGRGLALLGECVLGATVAERLGLSPGESLISSPETLFDLAGVYPLKMQVVGVLHPSHTPDDRAVFVELKTAWIIAGFGHGHEDVTTTNDMSVILRRSEGSVTANAKLSLFTEITDVKRDAFHFHGDLGTYPLTAVIAVPHDTKSATILQGRYLTAEEPYQIVRPKDVIAGLLATIFRIRNVLDAVIILVGSATVLAMILIFALSLRLRQREITTMFKLGCRRLTVARLLAAEIAIIVGMSGVLCLGCLLLIGRYNAALVRLLVLG
jgi:putative ABC transport system permease protein